MATIQGPGGNAALTGFNAKLNVWQANAEISEVETTGFEDDDWETHEPVLLRLTGSAGGVGVAGTTSTMPVMANTSSQVINSAAAAITLTMATGKTYSFNGIVSGVNMNRPHAGKFDVTFNFQSTGPITVAWV